MNGDRERSLDWDQRLATERPGASYMRFSARAAGWCIVSHQGWDMTQAVSGCGGGSSRDRTPRWTTLMWRKTISPGPLPCTGSSQLVGLVLYPEPTE
jgi:hypothetical protein